MLTLNETLFLTLKETLFETKINIIAVRFTVCYYQHYIYFGSVRV